MKAINTYKFTLNMKQYILISLFLFLPICSYAQYDISGRIVDNNLQPIEYANIIVLDQKENGVVSGTISDSLGMFNLKTSHNRECTIEISFVGFKKFEQIIYESTHLGDITLEPDSELPTVTVTERKKIVEKKVDRLIFNVENSAGFVVGNAIDALKITPRVKVQNEQISMIGKGNMIVMVDDVVIQLAGIDLSDFLRSIHSDDIKRIEVITTPPAKYSAEGNSGIINIILKESKKETWNTSIKSIYQQATYAKGNLGGTFNMQKGKFQLSTALSYTTGSIAPNSSFQILYPDYTWEEEVSRRDYSDVLSSRIGIDYKFNEKLSTGFNYNFNQNNLLKEDENNTFLINLIDNNVDSTITSLGNTEYDKKINSFNYHFIYKIDTMNRKLSFDFDLFDYDNNTNRDYTAQTYTPNNEPIQDRYERVRNSGNQVIKNYSFNTDMEHPSNWANFNYGLRIAQTSTDNTSNHFDVNEGVEILNHSFSNKFNYTENTQALYFSADKKLSEKWEAKLGLRGEFTQTEGYSRTLNQTNKNEYSKLFPTVYFTYSHDDNHTFGVNYSERINRPSFWLLNPFRFVSNRYSFSEGNPFLQPAYTKNFEFSYAYKNKSITSIYYSHTTDGYEQVVILDTTTNIQQVKPLNFIDNKMFGVNQSLMLEIGDWWSLYVSGDVYYSETSSKIPETLSRLNGWTGELYTSSNIILNREKTMFFNTSLWSITKGVDNLDYNSSDLQCNASFKWLLLNKSLAFNIAVSDIINPKGMKYTSFSNGIKNSFENYYDERYFIIGLVYNFGKEIDINNRSNKNQDEHNRLQ